MNYRPKITQEVRDALMAADRGPGWNSRAPVIKRFEIGFELGRCVLYIVPASRWAYRTQEKQRAAHTASA